MPPSNVEGTSALGLDGLAIVILPQNDGGCEEEDGMAAVTHDTLHPNREVSAAHPHTRCGPVSFPVANYPVLC